MSTANKKPSKLKSAAKKKIAEKIGLTPAKPISVRFSTNHNAWVQVDPRDADRPIRTLPVPSFLENVSFENVRGVVRVSGGCGGSVYGNVGLATGVLHETQPKKLKKTTDFVNLGFDGQEGYFHAGGDVIKRAQWVRLGDTRYATVKV